MAAARIPIRGRHNVEQHHGRGSGCRLAGATLNRFGSGGRDLLRAVEIA